MPTSKYAATREPSRQTGLRVAAWSLAGAALIVAGALALGARGGRDVDSGSERNLAGGPDDVARGAASEPPSSRSGADSGARGRSAPSRPAGSRQRSAMARAGGSGSESGAAAGDASAASPAPSPAAGTGVLRGRLLDAETARPLRQATAQFALQKGSRLQSRAATTDAEGGFVLDGLAAGDYRLRSRVAGYRPDLRGVRVGDGQPVDIHLETGLSIEGIVEDTEGQPVSGARIRWLRRDGRSSGSARRRSDAGGRFRISGLAPGSGLLDVSREGYRAPLARSIDLPSDGPLRIVLEFDEPLPVLIVDRDGRGIAGATLRWRVAGGLPGSGRPPASPPRLTSGPDGRARVRGVPAAPGARLTISVQHPDYLRAERSWTIGELFERAQQQGETRIALEKGARIAGVVVSADGHPAPGARLTLTARDLQRSLPATTDGRFAFRHLAPDRRLTLAADGGELGQALVEQIDPSNPASGALRVVLRKDGGTLAGRVLDAGERPIVRAVVEARTRTRHFTAYTSEDGGFRLEGIPPGEYGLRVSSRGHGSAVRRGVPTGSTDLRIVLGARGSLRGRAAFSGPPRAFTVRLNPREPGSAELLYRFTARDLVFECPGVPAGDYDVSLVQGGEVLATTRDVTIRSGESAGPIEFRP